MASSIGIDERNDSTLRGRLADATMMCVDKFFARRMAVNAGRALFVLGHVSSTAAQL